jgi:hypothetical protein
LMSSSAVTAILASFSGPISFQCKGYVLEYIE